MRSSSKGEQNRSWRASCNGSYGISNNAKAKEPFGWGCLIPTIIVLTPLVYWLITSVGVH